MKKVSIVLSALAVAATVSTAMAHTKAVNIAFCLAQEDDTTIPYNGASSIPCPPTIATVLGQTPATNPFTAYGYAKTTPAGQRCQLQTTCPALRFTVVE